MRAGARFGICVAGALLTAGLGCGGQLAADAGASLGTGGGGGLGSGGWGGVGGD